MSIFLEGIFLFLIPFFLVMLGSDDPAQTWLRMVVCGISAVLFLAYYRAKVFYVWRRNYALICLSFFLFFQLTRAIWGGYHLWSVPLSDPLAQSMQKAFVAAFPAWFLHFFLFLAGQVVFEGRPRAVRFMEVLTWTTGIMALNAIPALFRHPGRAYYSLNINETSFFHPFFYFHPWIKEYFLGSFAHPNYGGDILSLGFFTALGLGVYKIFQYFEEKKRDAANEESKGPVDFAAAVLLRCMLSLVIATAVFLFFSRGTMLTFLVAAGIYCLVFLAKYPSQYSAGIVSGFLVLTFVFLAWGANLKGAWKEIRTLESEQKALGDSQSKGEQGNQSIFFVKEGIRRSLAIYKQNSFWGIGTKNYVNIAKHFADPERGITKGLVNLQSLCHYAQKLAEEGVGAYLYFVFLGIYFLQVFWRLVQTQSRFKFIMGLSLTAPLIMIFLHASFNQLMEQFAMTFPVFFIMGVCSGVLRQDAKCETVRK